VTIVDNKMHVTNFTRLILQVDLEDATSLTASQNLIRSINAAAEVIQCERCAVDLAAILDRGTFSPERLTHLAESSDGVHDSEVSLGNFRSGSNLLFFSAIQGGDGGMDPPELKGKAMVFVAHPSILPGPGRLERSCKYIHKPPSLPLTSVAEHTKVIKIIRE
jgi:hypothetical protein